MGRVGYRSVTGSVTVATVVPGASSLIFFTAKDARDAKDCQSKRLLLWQSFASLASFAVKINGAIPAQSYK